MVFPDLEGFDNCKLLGHMGEGVKKCITQFSCGNTQS